MTQGQMYDAASNILAQRLSQLSGIGNVIIGGSTLPAVRVELNPQALYKYGIGLEDVRAALASANANSPKGTIDDGNRRYQIYTNDQANVAADYAPLVIAYRNGAAVRLSDVADVYRFGSGPAQSRLVQRHSPRCCVILFRQPNANIIETIDNVKAELPHLEAAMPADMNVTVAIDRSTTIRASLHDTELTLVMADPPGHARRLSVPAQHPRDADPERCGAGLDRRHVRRHVSVRLQPRYAVADGADDRHRLCRRRRHRRPGKHFPAYRRGHAAAWTPPFAARARSASP